MNISITVSDVEKLKRAYLDLDALVRAFGDKNRKADCLEYVSAHVTDAHRCLRDVLFDTSEKKEES